MLFAVEIASLTQQKETFELSSHRTKGFTIGLKERTMHSFVLVCFAFSLQMGLVPASSLGGISSSYSESCSFSWDCDSDSAILSVKASESLDHSPAEKSFQEEYNDRSLKGASLESGANADVSFSLLKDVWPGSNSSEPEGFSFYPYFPFPFDGRYFFAANDGVTGYETWVTDGTGNGTRLLADLETNGDSKGSAISDKIYAFVDGSSYVYFENNGSDQEELWRTDGTGEGTEALLSAERIVSIGILNGNIFIVAQLVNETSLLRMDLDGSNIEVLSLDYPVQIATFNSLDLLLVTEESPDRNATIWASTTRGDSFELFLDSSLLNNETECPSLTMVATSQPFADEYLLFQCRDEDFQRETWVTPFAEPDAAQFLFADGRVGIRYAFGKDLFVSRSLSSILYLYNGTENELEILIDITNRTDDSRIRATFFLDLYTNDTMTSSKTLYYIVEVGSVVETAELSELWTLDMLTKESMLLYSFNGTEATGGTFLLDGRFLLATSSPTTADFWILQEEREPTVDLVYAMNLTASDENFYRPNLQRISSTQLAMIGYDEDHGFEPWTISYSPRFGDDGEDTQVPKSSNDIAPTSTPSSDSGRGSTGTSGSIASLTNSFAFGLVLFSLTTP